MAKIKLSPLAISDLQEIKSYISDDLSNPIAANRVINQIIDDYTLLETSPEMGVSLSAKINITTDYRYLVSGKYIVFYKTDTEYVYISRILYGARDYIRILDRNGFFETTILSEDDQKRNDMYRANANRKKSQHAFTDYHAYL